MWDVATGKNTDTFRKGHNAHVRSLAFSPDGKTLASCSEDKLIQLWDMSNGRNTATLRGHTNYIFSIAFSKDGKTLASCSEDKTIKLWDIPVPEKGR